MKRRDREREPGSTRREFLQQTFVRSASLSLTGAFAGAARGQTEKTGKPWYRRAYRWGQTNINELDPTRYDIDWWRSYWKKTHVQGLVINAGGIIAYYPSSNRLQYRARYLGERDLYGELVRAAHQEGIFVLARMDSNRAHDVSAERHRVLQGFEETVILAFGGLLHEVSVDEGVAVPITFIPSFPAYPPETSWMRRPRTNTPALTLKESDSGGRCVYLAADVDRRFARDNLPDHGDLLANLVRWAAADDIPLHVEGSGLIDCHLYRQPGRIVLHLVNVTSAGTWRSPVHELVTVGPFGVRMRMPDDVSGEQLRLLVAKETRRIRPADGWVQFEVAALRDHEVALVE